MTQPQAAPKGSASKGQRPRAPGMAYTAMVTALLVVVAAVALNAAQPPPPAIAEFAPQAVQQIKQSQQGQGEGEGQGEGTGKGACQAGAVTCGGASPSPPAGPILTKPGQPAIDVARVRACVGSPPRQTEDPQSPPCVPYFNGPNGGATYNGVTADTINIYCTGCDAADSMIVYFNRRFEFYGRKLKLVDAKGCETGGGAAGQRQFADCMVREKHVFAMDTQASDQFLGQNQFPLKDQLARDKAIAYSYMPEGTTKQLAQHAPYWWQYSMATDTFEENQGEWACNQLVGGLARHAGGRLNALPRKFGILLMKSQVDDPTTSAPLKAALARCGVTIDPENDVTITPGAEADTDTDTQYTTTMVTFNKDNVTSVFCLCVEFQATQLGSAASAQNYEPEWLASTYGLLDTDWGLGKFGFGSAHLPHVLGLTFVPRQVPISRSFTDQAVKEGTPSEDPYYTANGFKHQVRDPTYRDLLLLASGIQMAGPHLTPETFAAGLHKTVFPNPFSDLTPGKVGFNDGGYAMTVDAAEYYWSPTAQSPYRDNGGSAGSICYVDRGARHRLGEWPKRAVATTTNPAPDDPVGRAPCFSGGSG